MIPLAIRGHGGPIDVEEWVPCEQPGLALAHYEGLWRLVHIRSGLTVAGCEDRALLLDLGLPALAHVDWTAPAAEIVATHAHLGPELRLLGLDVPGRPHPQPVDIDQHPALAPLSGRS